MIKRLKLTNFRKFKKYEVEFKKPLVVIHGDNTKGKSTVLEAIYVLTNGHSPWGSNEDIYNYEQKNDENFRVEADIEIDGDMKTYAYFREGSKRVMQIDGSNTTSKKFFAGISSTIFNPELIEILMISPSKRREFLDDILGKIDLEFSDLTTKFRKSLRQRNAYLKKLSKQFYETGRFNPDDKQLAYWTELFSKFSAEVIAKRAKIVDELKTDEFTLHYKSTLDLDLFEEMAKPENLAELHSKALMEKVKRDIALGYTNIGAHRDDWSIMNGRDVKRFGSRGEKRLAIAKLIFQTQKLVAENKGYEPYLLLDDIPSELDKTNTKFILNPEVLEKQQSFVTTINLDSIPKEIQKEAQIISLE